MKLLLSYFLCSQVAVIAFAPTTTNSGRTHAALLAKKVDEHESAEVSRRSIFSAFTATGAAMALVGMSPGTALADTDVESFLQSGQVSMPMGVSGQAGKSRPETGIYFRDGSEVSRDTRSGNVLAEIVLGATSSDPTAILASFTSPWSLGKFKLES